MKTITILVPETAVPAAVVDPRYMFTAVNRFFTDAGKPAPFKVQLAGRQQTVHLLDGLVQFKPDLLIEEVTKTDLIIIPALSGPLSHAIQLNQPLVHWLVNQYQQGAEIASLCLGAFLLASTGLVNGKSCSTHWLFANEFRNMFPQVKLVDDKLITDQSGIYSSGGATAYWNLLLYLVEKYTNRETAILAAKFFLLDVGKSSQSPFMIFRGQKEHEAQEILKVQEFIEQNFDGKISVDDLSNQVSIGRRSFERRFKKATRNTVMEYLQRVKIEAAKKLLEAGRKNVNEVMYEVGYSDNKAFRDVFRKYTAMSPIDYRFKYNQQANT